MFKWLNKQGVESTSGFAVQFTGRSTCEYREAGHAIQIEVESGFSGSRPSISINRDVFAKWGAVRPFHEAPADKQARLIKNFKDAMAFQGLEVNVY
ncbi:MAG: hypothetical protein ABI478_00535 [Propionivibrio sp.]